MNISSRPVVIILFIFCNSLLLVGGLESQYAVSDQAATDQVTNDWLDIRSIFSEVGVYIIIAILSFIGYYIRYYFVNNGKWKEAREKFEHTQQFTNESFTNAVKLIVDDLKQYKETNSKEIEEIRTDYKAINNKVIQNEERLHNIKDNITDLKKDIRNKQ